MTTLELFWNIKEAYETSTHNTNRFAELLNSVQWDTTFTADGELYFVKGDMSFTTPALDPFEMPWQPSAIFRDGSVLTI